jgi:hypothetical protein
VPEYEGREWAAVLRMMPDYGTEALWMVAGSYRPEAAGLPIELEEQLRDWVGEWERFHDCAVPDDTHEEWAQQGRQLFETVAAHYERFNVLLLADFEGTGDEQVTRRRSWIKRWPNPGDQAGEAID